MKLDSEAQREQLIEYISNIDLTLKVGALNVAREEFEPLLNSIRNAELDETITTAPEDATVQKVK